MEMRGTTNPGTALEDVKVSVKIKVSALWVSVMFCYIYGDFFELFMPADVPGSVQGMLKGAIGPIDRRAQLALFGGSLMMAVPSVMIFLSVALKSNLNRRLNIIFGVIYTAIILITMWFSPIYMFWGPIEVVLTGLIVWYAWHWPMQEAPQPSRTPESSR